MGHNGIAVSILQLSDGCSGDSALSPESVDVEGLTISPVHDSMTPSCRCFSRKM